MNGRQYVPGNGPNSIQSSFTVHAQQEARDADFPRSHARDPSGSRERGPALPNIAISNMQSQQANSSVSPRSQSTANATRSPANLHGSLERRPSATQNHFRQPSRAHSNYPQSRNAIFVSSPTVSPLSPETPSSANTLASQTEFSNNTTVRRQASVRYPNEPTTTLNGVMQTTSVTASASPNGDRDLGNTNSSTVAQKRVDRTQTSKPRSVDHRHYRSQSRHRQEQKSVGEYALHHLFNKVGLRIFYRGLALIV